ncbi:MAG: NAD(P)/FAD-dependent oxidoreductase [Thermomicrobiales bacterium]
MSERASPVVERFPETGVFDAVVVGAGFAGMYMLHRLRGLGLSTRVYEAGSGVGGTWYWNRYPGARCDVESVDYSYSFSDELQQEWCWTERYAAQPEILRYAEHVADRFDLRRDIRFDTRVIAAHFDEATGRWQIETDRNDRVSSRFCIMATGTLSTPQEPPFPGLKQFSGAWYQTGRWPHHAVDFSGQRVAVIGTGSSAIQSIPVIASQASSVTVFQRTANYSVPAHNRPQDKALEQRIKANYGDYRRAARESRLGFVVPTTGVSALSVSAEARQAEYERRWQRGGLGFAAAFNDLLVNQEANDTAAHFFREKIRGIVTDRATADALCPTGYPLGTKRVCVDTNYYDTYNQDHVSLVDLRRERLLEITAAGVRTATAEYAVDSIVFAIGFDAMTGTLLRMDIRGRSGESLRDRWSAGPRSYLGLAVAGFPNLFMITGPTSPSVLSNVLVSIEQHVEWIVDCIGWLGTRGHDLIEATPEAEAAWMAHADELARITLYPLANSWYTGANIPGKPRMVMPYVGGVGAYRKRCDEIAANGYQGFMLSGPLRLEPTA